MKQQVLKATPATISAEFLDHRGIRTAPSAPVAVSVKRLDGTAVTSGTATIDDTTANFNLSVAQTAQLDWYEATFTDDDGRVVVTQVEIVGGFYFTVEEAREFSESLSRSDKYDDDKIIKARQEVEERFEVIMLGRSFVPRFRRVMMDGPGGYRIELPNPGVTKIRSLSNNGSVFTAEQLQMLTIDPYGIVTFTGGAFTGAESYMPGKFWSVPGGITVEYEYGETYMPLDLKNAAISYCRYLLSKSNSGVHERATTISNPDGGSSALAVAGRAGFETGLPEIDWVVLSYRTPVSAIA